jgi:hypothetical protein
VSSPTSNPRTLIDFLSSAQDGVNSGVSPLLLTKSQMAFGLNCSIRGGYLTHRPPVSKKTFIFQNPPQQALIEQGFFQGGGYYRPDFGPQQLIAQISGHLFTFTETGNFFTVAEISVVGDLNDPTVRQVWMWQSEKWMIITDGTAKLPIFYDGSSSRRSFGPSVLLGTTIASGNFPSPRVIGEVITVNLTANYTGPFGVPVLFDGAFYQPVQSFPSGLNASLTNVTATPGGTVLTGSVVMGNAGFSGIIISGGFSDLPHSGFSQPRNITVQFQSVVGMAIGSVLLISNPIPFGTAGGWTVTIIDPNTNKATLRTVALFSAGSPGTTINNTGQIVTQVNAGPGFAIGTSLADFIVPAVGATVNISLNAAYTGTVNQLVSIGSDYYTISPVPNPGLSSSVLLINLTDTANAGQAILAKAPTILSVPELPAGRIGAYGLQQNWMSLTDGLSFIFSDISGSASGTPANNYRDAVLKTTQLSFRAGNFSIPSSGETINAIWFTANLDSALGQGSLLIGTDSTVFSCLAPIDAAVLANITSPILTESLIGSGPLGQNSTILVNSDTLFRSNIGDGSLVLARRDFGSNAWGNKPISNEVNRILDLDDKSLLSYGSSESFDNRRLSVCSPRTAGQGIFHAGMTSLNFDLLSSLRGSYPPSWEGLWTGLNVMQLIKGRVNGVIRSFAFSVNLISNKLELYELLHENTASFQDNDATRIMWGFETPALFNKDIKPITELCQLSDGEVYLSNIRGTVDIQVQYRPDFYPCWTTWRQFTVCETDAANPQPGYRMRIGLGTPDVTPCEVGNNRPLRNGNFFQFRAVITGSCIFMGMQVKAIALPQTAFAPIECTVNPCQSIDCTVPDYFELYSLQTSLPS